MRVVTWLPEPTVSVLQGIVGVNACVVVEVGCNDGMHTKRFLEAFPEARIYCFEPDPRPVLRFKRDIIDSRVVLIEKAVSDVDAMLRWHASHGVPPTGTWDPAVHADWDASGSLLEPTGHLEVSPWVTFTRDYLVDCVRLDTWLGDHPEIPCIDFMWADTQGGEGAMVAGGQQTLSRTRFLYTEFYDEFTTHGRHPPSLYAGQLNFDGLLRAMPDGYVVAGMYGGNNVLLRNTLLVP